MIIPTLYPWQNEAWHNWQHYLTTKKVPHAILLHGSYQKEIYDFALRLCCSLLCISNNSSKPCLECNACHLFLAGSHPDCLIIEAEQTQIKIEQIRTAMHFLQISRHYTQHKIVLLKEADKLNYAAANSLLKTLEEPPAESVLLMSCVQPSALTATIRSRCHRIYLKEASAQAIPWLAEQLSISITEAQQRLRMANNSPLAALENTSDNENKLLFYEELKKWLLRRITTHDFVDHWHDKPSIDVQRWLLDYLQHSIITCAQAMSEQTSNTHNSNLSALLYWLYPRQIERCRLAKQNINPRLLLEGSLLEWRKAYYGKAVAL